MNPVFASIFFVFALSQNVSAWNALGHRPAWLPDPWSAAVEIGRQIQNSVQEMKPFSLGSAWVPLIRVGHDYIEQMTQRRQRIKELRQEIHRLRQIGKASEALEAEEELLRLIELGTLPEKLQKAGAWKLGTGLTDAAPGELSLPAPGAKYEVPGVRWVPAVGALSAQPESSSASAGQSLSDSWTPWRLSERISRSRKPVRNSTHGSMTLRLSLSHEAKTHTHDSDKSGVTDFYDLKNEFYAKRLTAKERGGFLVENMVAVSDRQGLWFHEDARNHAWVGYPTRVRSRYEAESILGRAKTEFERRAHVLQKACNRLGLTCNQYRVRHQNSGWGDPFFTFHVTILLKEEIRETLVSLRSLSLGEELESWLSQALMEFDQMPVAPVRQREEHPQERQAARMHIQDFCDRCQMFGRLCSLSMEPSSSPKHPRGAVVKGLPQDITTEQLREIVENYGEVSRIYLPPENPGFSSRIAFVTFRDLRFALQRFHRLRETGSL
ncbi:MAG: RNA-binding protein [Myxococcaceae bacterium]|nr:RNA-binding protein [Myxococcaceae bacterium]MBH2006548.1 RNA-binding protein [Myxococcaceae bacterium]